MYIWNGFWLKDLSISPSRVTVFSLRLHILPHPLKKKLRNVRISEHVKKSQENRKKI